MKKVLLVGFILLASINDSAAQNSTEVSELSSSLPDLWILGRTDEAVQRSLRLYELNPNRLFWRINSTLCSQLVRGKYKNAAIFIEKLYQQNNHNLNKFIKPVYLWSKAMGTNDTDSLKEIVVDLSNTLGDSIRYWSKAETYCLLTLNTIESKNVLPTEAKVDLVYKIIQRMESHPFLNKEVTGSRPNEEKAWCRFLLAYSYHYLYTTFEKREEFLRKASEYSPDSNDRLYESGYMYDASLLIGGSDNINYKLAYQNFLLTNNRNSESLNLLSEIVFENPCDSNIYVLSARYSSLYPDGSFKDYWGDYLNKKGKPFPVLRLKFEPDVLDFSKKPGNWILIDVWGTWCEPCIEELPGLQTFFDANRGSDKLKIYTFSYDSRNLEAFMQKKKYSFPVCKIDKEVKRLLQITGFPTKFLVTPGGNYFEIPFGKDWQLYLKNYILL